MRRAFAVTAVVTALVASIAFEPAQLEQLMTGTCPLCDLRDTVLLAADLTDADLKRADLTNVDLRYANLTAANLTDADLSGASMSGPILCNTIMPDEFVLYSGF